DAAADRRRLRLPPGLRGAQARAAAAGGRLPRRAAERGARDPRGRCARRTDTRARGAGGTADPGPRRRRRADRRRRRGRAPRAARPHAVRQQARLPAAGEGRLDARRRHLRRRPGRGAARFGGAQRAGGGGTRGRRDHDQAPRTHEVADPPAAAQPRLRADRGGAGQRLRHRRPVLRPGARGLMAAVDAAAAAPSLDALLSAQTVWRAGRAPATAAGGEPTGHAALDALLPQGGWPRRALTELLLPADGVGELSLLLPTLARMTQAGTVVAVVAPPYLPYAPA